MQVHIVSTGRPSERRELVAWWRKIKQLQMYNTVQYYIYIQQYDAENSNTRHLACMIQWKGWRGSCRLKEDQAARPRQPIRLALPFPPGRSVGSLGTLIFILIHIDEVLISCWLTLLSFCYAYSSCCTILFCLLWLHHSYLKVHWSPHWGYRVFKSIYMIRVPVNRKEYCLASALGPYLMGTDCHWVYNYTHLWVIIDNRPRRKVLLER